MIRNKTSSVPAGDLLQNLLFYQSRAYVALFYWPDGGKVQWLETRPPAFLPAIFSVALFYWPIGGKVQWLETRPPASLPAIFSRTLCSFTSPGPMSLDLYSLVRVWKIEIWTAGRSRDLLREDSDNDVCPKQLTKNVLSKDVVWHTLSPRVLLTHLVPRTPSWNLWDRIPRVKGLHFKIPDECTEGVHINSIFPEFVCWDYFCFQTRPVPFQTSIFQEQTKFTVGLLAERKHIAMGQW